MSADAWARCPFCITAARTADEQARQKVADAYGKVSADEYERMRSELPDAFDPWAVKETLREDWELGFGGDVDEDPASGLLSYSARCTTCGASAKIDGAITLKPGGATSDG